jgi:flavin-binding protein dodecin
MSSKNREVNNLHEFDIIEKAGVSTNNYTDAVKNALNKIEKQIYWFEVIEHRGRVTQDNKIEFQVVVKIGCA